MSQNLTPEEKITPFEDLKTASKSDTVDLADGVAKGFMVQSDGNVRILTPRGTDITIPVLSGAIYPIRVKRVFATSTTVGNVLVGY